jgi:hypothetical protein
MRQYRYLANGSVIKLMHARDPLPRRHVGGYKTLTIATSKVSLPKALADPEGNPIVLVPPGRDEVTQIEVRLGVTDVDAFERFYTQAWRSAHRRKPLQSQRHYLCRIPRPEPNASAGPPSPTRSK